MPKPATSNSPFQAPGTEETVLLALLRAIVQRDQAALAGLYDLTMSRVYGLALRVLKRPEDAEEATGDVFLQIWERASDYRPERGSVMAWINTLAWSRAVDRLRKLRHRQGEQELHPEGSDDAYMWREDDSADQVLAAWMSAQAIRQAFKQLSPGQQKMLELAYFEDLSHPEIAERTGVALGTVKSHIRRGLAVLRTVMTHEEKA